MKKKQLAWVLTMAMTAGMLVPYGAAAEEATEAETTGTEAAAGEVKDPFDYDYVSEDVDADLTIYRYYADTDKVNLDYAINKMQEKYPNLTLRWSIVPILTDRPCAPGRQSENSRIFSRSTPRRYIRR